LTKYSSGDPSGSDRITPCPDCLLRDDLSDFPVREAAVRDTDPTKPKVNVRPGRSRWVRSCEECEGKGFLHSRAADPYLETPEGDWHEKRVARAEGRQPDPEITSYWTSSCLEYRRYRPVELKLEDDPNPFVAALMQERPGGHNHGRRRSTDWNHVDIDGETAPRGERTGWTTLEPTDENGFPVAPIVNSDGIPTGETLAPSYKTRVAPSRRHTGRSVGRPRRHTDNAAKQRAYRARRKALRNSVQVSEENRMDLQNLSPQERDLTRFALEGLSRTASDLAKRIPPAREPIDSVDEFLRDVLDEDTKP